MSPSLTDYARISLTCILREFAMGDMPLSAPKLVAERKEEHIPK